MKLRTKVEIPLLVAIAVVMSYGITSWGQPDTPHVRFHWTAPTTGSPVILYIGQIEIDGNVAFVDSIMNTYYDFTYPPGPFAMRMRVAGEDSLERVGPWSEWSDMWNDDGPPGQPGDMSATLILQE